MQITNPFTDTDFASFQLKSGRASKLINQDGQIIYKFPFNKNLCMLYTYKDHPDLIKLAKQENAIFTLIENNIPTKNKTKKFFREITPRHTLILDLSKSEEELLKEMHQKGRYNIRLAEKKGVKIMESNDINDFYKILKDTALRDKFFTYSKDHYESLLKILEPKNKAKLFMAYFENEPIAGILNIYIGNTATYYYGASSNKHRNLMAPYLLQWHAIKDAKKRGFAYYDFLGIADPENPKDELKKVTDFKTKFGGTHAKWQESKILIHKPLLHVLLKLKRLIF